jgi:hypothetical protein
MGAPSKWPWDSVRIAVMSGFMTLQECADKWGIPIGTVCARSARERWLKPRESNIADKVPELAVAIARRANNDPPASVKVNAILETLGELREEIRHSAGRVTKRGLKAMEAWSPDVVASKAEKLKALVDAGAKATGFDAPEIGVNLSVSLAFLRDMDTPTIESRIVELETA